ncbi:NAD-binding protein [Nocardioides convexus]
MLQRAGVANADQVIITTGRDDSNVLAALTVRQPTRTRGSSPR